MLAKRQLTVSRIAAGFTGALLFLNGCATHAANPGPSTVKVSPYQTGYRLTVDGQPFTIKGAGGSGPLDALKAVGGNSNRTWGADGNDDMLAQAQKLGMKITIGIWLGHKDHGFHYDDPAAVASQFENARKAVLRYKNSPALLLWDVGNEMEVSDNGADPKVWQAVQQIAAMIHKLDPAHPTMCTVAEVGGEKIANLIKYCPDIDIVGINSYGGGESIGTRYRAAGGTKPFVITEYGPPGTWEVGTNSWGAAPEMTSTQKADFYQRVYRKGIKADPWCLGSYAFTWGSKQEATSTWFGLLLPDGSRLGAVDALSEEWTGKRPVNLCPVIETLKQTGAEKVKPGEKVHVTLDARDPDSDPMAVKWVLQYDPVNYHTGGATEGAPPTYPAAITNSDIHGADIVMPEGKGGYRIYAYIHDNHGGAAVGNVPLYVETVAAAPAKKGDLPFSVYAEGEKPQPFIPAGYMGNTGAIAMDPASTVKPHSGSLCLKVSYSANDNWGGVVWQSPANNWGDQPGGYDLSGAKKLTFWARGEAGGETVTFLYGLIGADKTYHDSGSAKLENIHLTSDWKQYTMDLSGKDLTNVITGFAWTLAGAGHPLTFYLDDIRYE